MRGLAGAMVIEQQRALVEKLGLRRIEVFRPWRPAPCARPPKAIDPAGAVVDREHHAVAEAVVGHGDVLAVDAAARPSIICCGARRPWPPARRAARICSAGAIAEPELALRRRRRAGGRRDSRAPSRRSVVQRGLEKSGGERQHVVQGGAPLFSRLAFRRCAAASAAPAIPASRSTASGKLRPSVSIRNVEDVAVLAATRSRDRSPSDR